ncbi:hypothetical protein HDU93_006051, partial [Gonapodya sp. JEL0774]
KERRHACYRPPPFKKQDIRSFAYHLGDWREIACDHSWQADALVVDPAQLTQWVAAVSNAIKGGHIAPLESPVATAPLDPAVDLSPISARREAPKLQIDLPPPSPLANITLDRQPKTLRRGLTISLGSPVRRRNESIVSAGGQPSSALKPTKDQGETDESSEDEDFPTTNRRSGLAGVARAISRRVSTRAPP